MSTALLAAAFLTTAIQCWLVVGFLSHSFVWLLKAFDPTVTVGASGAVLMLICTLAAVVYGIQVKRGVVKLEVTTLVRLASSTIVWAGIGGQAVFWMLAAVGVFQLAPR